MIPKSADAPRGARFVALQSRNHLIPEDEPAYPHFREEIKSFLRG